MNKKFTFLLLLSCFSPSLFSSESPFASLNSQFTLSSDDDELLKGSLSGSSTEEYSPVSSPISLPIEGTETVSLYPSNCRPGTPTEKYQEATHSLDETKEREFSWKMVKAFERSSEGLKVIEQYKKNALKKRSSEIKQKKNVIKAGLASGGVGLATVLVQSSPTRSVDSLVLAGVAAVAGGAAVGGLGWWVWGNYMKTIVSFKQDLEGMRFQLKQLQPLTKELQEMQQGIEEQQLNAVKLTERILEKLPALKGISGDNARLANAFKLLLARQQVLEEQFLSTKNETKNDSLEDDIVFLPQTRESLDKKATLINQYNKEKSFWRAKVSQFEDLPEKWKAQFNP